MRVFDLLRSRAGSAPSGAVAVLVVAAIGAILVVTLLQEPGAPTLPPEATISAVQSPKVAASAVPATSALDGIHFTIVAGKGTGDYVSAVSQLLVDKSASVDGGDPKSVVAISLIPGSTDAKVTIRVVSGQVASIRLSKSKMKADILALGTAMDRWDRAQMASTTGQGAKE